MALPVFLRISIPQHSENVSTSKYFHIFAYEHLTRRFQQPRLLTGVWDSKSHLDRPQFLNLHCNGYNNPCMVNICISSYSSAYNPNMFASTCYMLYIIYTTYGVTSHQVSVRAHQGSSNGLYCSAGGRCRNRRPRLHSTNYSRPSA